MTTYLYGFGEHDDDVPDDGHEQVKCEHCGFWFYQDEGCECREGVPVTVISDHGIERGVVHGNTITVNKEESP